MPEFTLVIGNKAYSSWSMRPWLALTQTGAPFEDVVINLFDPNTKQNILRHSPSGKVPVLKHGDRTIWDSLAIVEYLGELFPNNGLWPKDAAARALARSVAAEMHSGFVELRKALPMNVRRVYRDWKITPEVQADITRISALWRDCRQRFGEPAGGPFLFGGFTIADAMFAPVVTRFNTYSVALDGDAQAYCSAVLAHTPVKTWFAEAEREPWISPAHEF